MPILKWMKTKKATRLITLSCWMVNWVVKSYSQTWTLPLETIAGVLTDTSPTSSTHQSGITIVVNAGATAPDNAGRRSRALFCPNLVWTCPRNRDDQGQRTSVLSQAMEVSTGLRGTPFATDAGLALCSSMVNDPTTDHLIKWADDGRSFYSMFLSPVSPPRGFQC